MTVGTGRNGTYTSGLDPIPISFEMGGSSRMDNPSAFVMLLYKKNVEVATNYHHAFEAVV